MVIADRPSRVTSADRWMPSRGVDDVTSCTITSDTTLGTTRSSGWCLRIVSVGVFIDDDALSPQWSTASAR